MQRKGLFNADKNGLIELFFTESELASNIELLVLVRKLCDAIIASHEQNPVEVDKEQVARLIEHSSAASDLVQKLLADSEVGVEKPDSDRVH